MMKSNVKSDTTVRIAETAAARLRRDGYLILRGLLPVQVAEGLYSDLGSRLSHTPFSVGEFHGARTKRCGALLKRSVHTAALVQNRLVLDIAETVLRPFCDCIQLNLTQIIEVHSGAPAQPPHRDHDVWPVPKSNMEFQVNVMWPLTPFRAENGATVVWPGSNQKLDQILMGPSKAIAAEMDPGDALIFLGSVLHGGGANRSGSPRTGVIVSYCLGWLKSYENQWLAYPPEVARRFPPSLAELVGYRRHRPNLGNYEGQCPSVLLSEKVPEYLGAEDGLSPEQFALMQAMLQQLRKVA